MENQQLSSQISILEADLADQIVKYNEIDLQNAHLSQIKKNLSIFLNKDAANSILIADLKSKLYQCSSSPENFSCYTTDYVNLSSSSSSPSDNHSEVNLYTARPLVYTFDVLTPETSGQLWLALHLLTIGIVMSLSQRLLRLMGTLTKP